MLIYQGHITSKEKDGREGGRKGWREGGREIDRDR